MTNFHFDIYSATAVDLQEWQQSGKLSAVDIVEAYLSQIDAHNVRGMGLRAVIDTVPRSLALERARNLDAERASKGSRGPLHGIPVLVKDLFNTDPALGLGTTCGSLALRDAKPKGNSPILDLLLSAGAIIIAKANLSELGNIKGNPACTSGWSAAGGQAQSPYVRGGVVKGDPFLGHSTPAGSSSGSAIGVAVGFAPISIGTECDGSIVYPATRAGLYSLKFPHGAFSMEGCFPFHPSFDCHGVFAKTTADILDFTSVILDKGKAPQVLSDSWETLRIGILDSEPWKLSAGEIKPDESFDNQFESAFNHAIERVEQRGAKVVRPIHMLTVTQLAQMDGGVDFDVIAFDNWKANVDAYLGELTVSPVRTLEEMIAFNKENRDSSLPPEQPSQKCLEDLLKTEPDSQFERKLGWLRQNSRKAIEQALSSYQVDVIIADGDSRLCAIASSAGYACGTMPLGYAHSNGRAFGVQIIAGEGAQGVILNVMKAWEKTFPEGRQAPPLANIL